MVVLAGLWVEPKLRGSELGDRVSSVILGLAQRPLGNEQSPAASIVPLTSLTENFDNMGVCFFLVVREDPEIAAVLAEIRAENPNLQVYLIKVDNSACGIPQLDHLCFNASKLWRRNRRLGRLLGLLALIRVRSKGSLPPSNALLLKIRADLHGLSYYLPDETIVGDGN